MNIEQMNTIVETIVNECESIISETENITEVVDLESFAEELLEIRTTAEELQTLILNIEESEYISNNMLDSLENQSIQLYQEIKYSFDNIETPPYDAQALVDAFFEAASILDEKNLPKQGRTAVLSPRQYYALVSQVDSNILNRDYGNTNGNLQSGEGLYEIAGISIKRSNNLPFLAGNVSSVNGENNDYSGNFSTHCGLIYYKDAAAVVEAIAPSVQTTSGDVSVMYQGDLIVGRLAMGCGTLNPAAAIELQSARS